MRIAVLTNLDLGLYKFRKELLRELCEHNEVYIILPQGEYIEKLEELGCRFVPLEFERRGKNPFADLKQIGGYKRTMRTIQPDVVLTYTIKPNIYGGIACRNVGIPYISNVTGLGTSIEGGGMISFIAMRLYRTGLKKAECVFFQNKANMDFFTNNKLVQGRIRLIPGSGVSLKDHVMESYPSSEEGIRFLFVGRIMRDKGIEELLNAIRVVRQDFENASVDIVGGSDEDYSEELKSAVENGSIHYHGLQFEMHSFYKECHCVVLPSYHEGMANVLLEASSTGRPVIATRVPGCRETFEEGITGFGCEPRSTSSLAEAMRKFLALSHEQREAMGRAAREKMEREFDRKIVVDAYLEEIEKTVSKSSEGK